MAVTERVNEIIKIRKSRVPQIDDKIKELTDIVEKIDNFNILKRSIIDESGNVIENSQYASIVDKNPDMVQNIRMIQTENLKLKIINLIESYKSLSIRFSRDYINIAVVGPARQGKSKWLQSVTGLGDKCIPAFTGSHCTGASSTIENEDMDGVLAELEFKTNGEMISEINGYLKTIDEGLFIYALDDLRGLKKKIEGYGNTLSIKGAVEKELVLERFIENFDEWRELVGRPGMTLSNEDEIMTYVAQHNGEKDESKLVKFYRFAAVKSAKIRTRFKYSDSGKIKLIDTVGLGSTENDTQKNMIATIQNESDGVIFFKRPEGAVIGNSDEADADIYDKLKGEFNDRKMCKWFTYILNHTLNVDDFTDNEKMCEKKKENIRTIGLPVMDIQILDVTDQNAVINDFLVPYLQALSNNLSEIDDVIMSKTQEKADDTFICYQEFMKGVERVVNDKVTGGQNWLLFFRAAFRETFNQGIAIKLKNLADERRIKKNQPCIELQEKIEKIYDTIDDMVPSAEDIHKIFKNDGGAQAHTVFIRELNRIRTDLTAKFIGVDTSLETLTTEFKNKVVDILLGDDCGRLSHVLSVDESKPKCEWLHDFSEKILDENEHSEIKRAVDYLYSFHVNVRGFLMHKVRIQLDLINPAIPESVNVNLNGNNIENSISFNISIKIANLRDNLQDVLGQLYQEPNEAFYATADEIYDRLVFSEKSKEQWELLYSEKSSAIWREKLDELSRNEVAFEVWNDAISTLNEYNKIICFKL